jgi:hypothetical protein
MIQSLTREECLARLSHQRVGRVSVSKDALPLIVPVIYVRDGSDLVFRSPLDAAFAKLCDHAVIAFEVDGLSVVGDTGWSVHVVGVASMLTGAEELRQRGSGMPTEAGLETHRTVRMGIERVSGQQIATRSTTAKAVEWHGATRDPIATRDIAVVPVMSADGPRDARG